MPTINDIQVLDLRPGNTLVVSIDDGLFEAEAAIIQKKVEEILPAGVRCLIIDKSVRVTVLTGAAAGSKVSSVI